MTYKTRQEVLRAAADWMDVCAAAGVRALGKHNGVTHDLAHMGFDCRPDGYEFPLALLEGKEVWVGSELYDIFGKDFTVEECHRNDNFDRCSWNKPKSATVMVEMLVEDAEYWCGPRFESIGGKLPDSSDYNKASNRFYMACKKALENLK